MENTGNTARIATLPLRVDLETRIQKAAAAAGAQAVAVDHEARFPGEAFAEIRKQRLLGLLIPAEFGGGGAGFGEILDVCYALGQACSSSGMIYAMHQVKVACIMRHCKGSPPMEGILRRIAADELLLSSSTTEGQAGGNIRASEAPVETDGERIRLVRKATCISYALDADGIVTTARRSADAPASDQVLLVFLKPDYTLEPLVGWNTLGMRGTCSEGFTLRANGVAGNIMPQPYDKIHTQSMVPSAHLMWGSTWAGIAAAATSRAQAFVRAAARGNNGQMPPGAAHVTEAVKTLRTLLGLLASSLRSFEQAMNSEEALGSLEFQSKITLTKVEASELAAATVLCAMRACGLSGYREDGEYSIARHLRDVLSAPIMINNDRVLANLALSALMTPVPATISR